MLMALPHLPHQVIPVSFQRLKLQETTPMLHELVDYVHNQWINTNTFPPRSWSVHGQPVCTNNDIEGWHNSLDRRAGGRVIYLSTYWSSCSMESPLCALSKFNSSMPENFKGSRIKKYRALQARIFGYWEDNAASKISSWRLLKACSYLAHGPVRTD